MQTRIGRASINHVEHGEGIPLVALHGAGVDHREIEAAIEPLVPATGYRRIYPDLPAMGLSTADGLTSNADVVTLLTDFVERIGNGPVLLLGHSYGAYVARGVAARRPDLLLGLAHRVHHRDAASVVEVDADRQVDLGAARVLLEVLVEAQDRVAGEGFDVLEHGVVRWG